MEQVHGSSGGSLMETTWPVVVGEWTARFVADAAETVVGLEDVARLAAVDPGSLDPAARVDLIAAWERVRARVDGLQQRALAAVVDATEAIGLDGDAARHEVGAALRLSPVTAYQRTKVAADLVRRLPATLAALEAGRICYLQAREVATAVTDLDPQLPPSALAEVEARVLAVAPDQTVAQTRRAVARAVIAADPGAAQHRHQKAAKNRSIEWRSLPDAMVGWWVTMPAPSAVAAWDTLTARAKATQTRIRHQHGTDPGLDALRVDALLDSILAAPAAPTPPATQPPATTDLSPQPAGAARLPKCRCGGAQTAAVVIDLPTLLGLAEHPGQLPGYGPIPPELARQLAADRDWVRWTTDPGTRRLLDHGARRYRPTDRLRRHLGAAAPHCLFPGCSRPAEQCDLDHQTPYHHGGATVVANLGPLCRQHHNAKTHGHWKLSPASDDRGDHDRDRDRDGDGDLRTGTVTWTSPLGHTYTTGTDPPLP